MPNTGQNPVKITRRGDKNGDGIIAADEFDQVSLTYDPLDRVTQASDAFGKLRD